jgi:hypothetical protein
MENYPKYNKVAKIIKQQIKYTCNICNYNTSKKCNLAKHLSTVKHQNAQIIKVADYPFSDYPKVANVQNPKLSKKKRFFCACGKNYQFKSGLCKHKKKRMTPKCVNLKKGTTLSVNLKKGTTLSVNLKKGTTLSENSSSEKEKVKNKEKIKMLEGELTEIKSVLKDFIVASTNNNNTQSNMITQYVKNMDKLTSTLENRNIMVDNKTVNITNNQNVTINVFLNEQCKDAINLTDWIENIKVTLEDLQYTKDNGFVNGVTNIINKQLQDLKPTERPIHCSDKKRLHFYVKDNDEWIKDVDNKKIDSTITHIKLKQSKSMMSWEELHPTYKKDPKLLDEWCSILAGITEGDTGNALKEKVQLKRKLASYIEIKEAMANN